MTLVWPVTRKSLRVFKLYTSIPCHNSYCFRPYGKKQKLIFYSFGKFFSLGWFPVILICITITYICMHIAQNIFTLIYFSVFFIYNFIQFLTQSWQAFGLLLWPTAAGGSLFCPEHISVTTGCSIFQLCSNIAYAEQKCLFIVRARYLKVMGSKF